MMVKYFQVDLKTMPAKITTESGLCSLMNLSDISSSYLYRNILCKGKRT